MHKTLTQTIDFMQDKLLSYKSRKKNKIPNFLKFLVMDSLMRTYFHIFCSQETKYSC